MRTWWVGLVLTVTVGAGVGGCTAPNPRSCIDGTCTTEEFPFCDVDGSFAGQPQTCISVECTPNEFAQCRGDEALSCNATGTDYESTSCPLGCQDGVGCRVCQPNETVCANGAVQTCDAGGTVVQTETCALGCFEDQPRCREVAPSNGLAAVIDQVPNAPDVVLENCSFNTTNGQVAADPAPAALMPSAFVPNGARPSIRVFVGHNVLLRNCRGVSTSNNPLAIVATGTLTIEGRLRVDGQVGGVTNGTCKGGQGFYYDTTSNTVRSNGSGGGGNATAGGRGGNIANQPGGAGGIVIGNDELVPLQGGCASGGVDVFDPPDVSTYSSIGSTGGGAVQLVSRHQIVINGAVDVRGTSGIGEQCGTGLGSCNWGGGGGGSALLEAPVVTIAASGSLIAKGGSGWYCGMASELDNTAAPASCGANLGTSYGASTVVPGGNGDDYPGVPQDGMRVETGPGGGGVGRVRINTATGTYTKDSTSVEAAKVTVGMLPTR